MGRLRLALELRISRYTEWSVLKSGRLYAYKKEWDSACWTLRRSDVFVEVLSRVLQEL